MIRHALELARPALRLLDPEVAHDLSVWALERDLVPSLQDRSSPVLETTVFGAKLDNPIGVAAGFDKNARAYKGLRAIGFGFVEVGTVTPRPQPGNPKPRIFRLPHARAVINRLGFNNEGHAAIRERIGVQSATAGLGVNIGANKDASDRVEDYVTGVACFFDCAHYLTVNISSPNTPGLRDLQAPQELDRLLARVVSERDRLADTSSRRVPIVVKLSPDIAEAELWPIIDCLISHQVDGIAATNTTIARDSIDPTLDHVQEAGGLSGPPVFERSTALLARIYVATGGHIPLIGIGGIDSGSAAVSKIRAGATLIQLYTGLIYRGLPLLDEIKQAVTAATAKAGGNHYSQLIGVDAETWATHPLQKAGNA
ncbi:MAG: quinone-dependent dihydroorotate dehydrogenase [Pseudomonadota bacterium]